jgi:hypothetical protein
MSISYGHLYVFCPFSVPDTKLYDRGGERMELAEIRHELEKTAKSLAGFRGSL